MVLIFRKDILMTFRGISGTIRSLQVQKWHDFIRMRTTLDTTFLF